MFETLWEIIQDTFYWTVNKLIALLASFITFVIDLLPTYTLPTLSGSIDKYQFLTTLNWLFPVGLTIMMVELSIISITLYFTLGTITRWAKVSS